MRTVSLINEVVKQIQSHTDGVVAIYVYGSHVYKNQNASSDIDVLVILMVVDPGQLCALRAIEDEYHSQGYDLGIMVHTAQEIDAGFGLQGEIFIHRNRCWFFIKEMQDHANLVWGKDMFTNIVLPSQSVLKTEAVRVLRSLTYEARKKYINKYSDPGTFVDLVKFTLHASKYFCFAFGFSFDATSDEIRTLVRIHPKLSPLQRMFQLRRDNYVLSDDNKDAVLNESVNLLEYMSQEASTMYTTMTTARE